MRDGLTPDHRPIPGMAQAWTRWLDTRTHFGQYNAYARNIDTLAYSLPYY